MAKISLSPTFLKDSLKLLKERGLKETILGKRVSLNKAEQNLLDWIKTKPVEFKALAGRQGQFIKIDLVHKGQGTVYLLPNRLGASSQESLVLFDEDTVIQPGPDLYLYLSTQADVRAGLGQYLDLGLIKGTKGGQAYIVAQPLAKLTKYKSAVIYCKQFSVLFTFASLN